jgi:hypothetical protein
MLNTYDQQINLVNRGLAILKNDGKYTTFKYSRKAMYDYLWYKEPQLKECRGHVYENDTKKLVQAAPTKCFNYLERHHWSHLPLDTPVEMHKKINGYMACATMHNGELVVSTTGTTTSEYAKWARELLNSDYKLHKMLAPDITTLFEVIVPQDPHIVQEREGLHLLGMREKNTGKFHPLGDFTHCTLKQAISIATEDRGEGFMIYPMLPTGRYDYNNCCKLKSLYYVDKKKLMRMTAKNIELMYTRTANAFDYLGLSEVWKFAPNLIIEHHSKEAWCNMTDQQRRKFLEYIE